MSKRKSTKSALNTALALAGGKSKAKARAFKMLAQFGVPESVSRRAYSMGSAALSLIGDRKKSRTKLTPQAISTSRVAVNPTWSEVVGKVQSSYAGRSAAGIKIRGRQGCAIIQKPSGVSNNGRILQPDVAGMFPDGDDFILFCNPAVFGGPMSVQASQYQMYVFRRLLFEFDTNTSSVQTGQYALCYVREPQLVSGGAPNVPSDFAEARSTIPSAVINYRADAANLEITYDGQQLFYTDFNVSNDEIARQTTQGQLRAYGDGVFDSLVVVGVLNVQYELDLFFPTTATPITFAARYMSTLTKEDLSQLLPHILELRRKRRGDRKVADTTQLVFPKYKAPTLVVVAEDEFEETEADEGFPPLEKPVLVRQSGLALASKKPQPSAAR